MANQTNEDFTKIPSNLLEAIIGCSCSVLKKDIILLLIRESIGRQKNAAELSLNDISFMLKRTKAQVSKAMKGLIVSRVIKVVKASGPSHHSRQLSINMKLKQWPLKSCLKGQRLPKKATVAKKDNRSVSQNDNRSVVQKDNPKNNKTPLNKGRNRNPKKEYSPESKEFLLSSFLLKLIRERRESFRMPEMQDWCRHMDLLINHDRQSPEEIERVIAWSQKERFWKLNIISTESLRNNYDKLAIQMEASKEEKKTAKKLVAESDRIRL